MEKKAKRQKESLKKKCILLIQLLILLVGIAGLFGKDSSWELTGEKFEETQGEDGRVILRSPPVLLKAGVYRVSLSYETADDMLNAWEVEAEGRSFDGLIANACMLYSGLSETDMYFWLTEKAENLQVKVMCDPSSRVKVESVRIRETNLGARMFLVIVLTGFTLWDILLYRRSGSVWRGMKPPAEDFERRCEAFGMILLILFSSIPLFTGYELTGTETGYQLLRIEGIKDGLLSGQFPVRIGPNWLQGYGYAADIFECDTFLYIPAFLRIMGFPVGIAYLFYKFMINVGTVVISCRCFGRIFNSRYIGLFGGGLYTLSIYRLVSMYIKDAAGQYTAMMFLPLFAYAVWLLLSEDIGGREDKRIWVFLSLSITGMIQSGLRTCALAIICGLIAGVVFFRRILRKKTMAEIGKAFLFVLGLNFWFFVPFLDYLLTQKLLLTEGEPYTQSIQEYGSFLPQLLGVFSLAGFADESVEGGMRMEIPFTVGAALLMGLVCFGYFWLTGSIGRWKDKYLRTLGSFSAVLSAVTLAMSTMWFPWDKSQSLGGFAGKWISALESPVRLLETAAVFLVLTGCCALTAGWKDGRKREVYLFTGTTLVLLVVVTGMFLSGLLGTSPFYKIYEENAMSNSNILEKKYLPAGTDETLLKAGRIAGPEEVSIDYMEKEYGTVTAACRNAGDGEGYIDLPLLYYKGYAAKDRQTGERFPVRTGENNVVRIELPAAYEGSIIVKFVSPWYWRMAEAVTAAAWTLFLYGCVRTGGRNRIKEAGSGGKME